MNTTSFKTKDVSIHLTEAVVDDLPITLDTYRVSLSRSA